MDVFQLDKHMFEFHSKFARSICKIRAPEILKELSRIYDHRRFWPDALVSMNPNFEKRSRRPRC